MSYHIVHVEDERLRRYAVRHIYAEWKYLFGNFYGVNTEEHVYDMFKTSPIVLYACLDSQGRFLGCFSLSRDGADVTLADRADQAGITLADRADQAGITLADRADQAGITLADVYVVPEHRGKAVGRAMVNYVIARCDAVKLHCESQHIAFYEKFGFDVRTSFVIKGADGAEKTMYVMHYSCKQDDIITPYIIYMMMIIGIACIILILWI
jgi:GNAT superfamily N-acetyltransferase